MGTASRSDAMGTPLPTTQPVSRIHRTHLRHELRRQRRGPKRSLRRAARRCSGRFLSAADSFPGAPARACSSSSNARPVLGRSHPRRSNCAPKSAALKRLCAALQACTIVVLLRRNKISSFGSEAGRKRFVHNARCRALAPVPVKSTELAKVSFQSAREPGRHSTYRGNRTIDGL